MQEDGKAWSGRFAEPIDALTQRFNASVDFDRRLAEFDIQGSLAHARMLARAKILSAGDLAAIERGMSAIQDEIRSGRFGWTQAREDVHLNIEARLTELVGEAGKRLHTARSRNDQVATDMRLWLRSEIDTIQDRLKSVRTGLVDLAEKHAGVLMPGFTHMQVAQPVTFGHHLLAYFEMFSRDAARLVDCRKRVNHLPLGASALAGTSYPIDRESVARAQVGLLVGAVGRRERRDELLAELDLDVAALGDLDRRRQRLGPLRERGRHLRVVLQVELVRLEGHLRRGERGLRLHAQQRRVMGVVLATQVVDVAGGHERAADLAGDPHDALVGL
ncbi:MAG TPA: lyase family protein, partial [Usitatibacter sp.]|nr:lyase family protein [Usitatibacter sp.]